MAKKVLIVEDDSNIAELLHLYLEKEGFETAVAGDGGKGVELFRSFRPDLVLLDIMLPVMDGWSVLKKIRENDKTPVIMLTAKGETQDKVAGLEGGADDYIVKPFEMKEVLARIHAVLRRFGADPARTLVLEDSLAGIRAANAGGFTSGFIFDDLTGMDSITTGYPILDQPEGTCEGIRREAVLSFDTLADVADFLEVLR